MVLLQNHVSSVFFAFAISNILTHCYSILFSVLKYKVRVHTSSQDNSDTTANAYISIHGDKGHTGVRQLRKSDQDKLFQKGQTDLFEIEAVDLGSLQKVIVGHDGKDAGKCSTL